QLRVLREAGVVRKRRVGRQILYRLSGGDARALARNGIARAAFRSTYSTRKDAVVTYIIAEPCIDIKDKSCVDVCPVDCIHEAARILVIDPEECIDCGACEPECPVEAIFPEDSLPDKWQPFVKINYAYGDTDTINRLVDEYADRAQRPEPAARNTSAVSLFDGQAERLLLAWTGLRCRHGRATEGVACGGPRG